MGVSVMKNRFKKIKIYTGVMVLIFSVSALGLDIGDVETSGNICLNPLGSSKLRNGPTSDSFIIPLGAYLKKGEDKNLLRGSCTFALPIKGAPGKRIVVKEGQQFYSVRAFPELQKAKLDVELFKAGSQGQRQAIEVLGANTIQKSNGHMISDVILTTACDEDIILRGNLSAFAVGNGKGQIFTKDLHLKIIEEDCP